MKKWKIGLVLIVIILLAFKANGQTYTQSFIDKCTGEKKVATTTMVNGYATVSFYNEVKTFSPIEVQTGQLQIWINQVYLTYSTMACPVNNPIVQQTVTNTVTQAASTAASQAASSAASAAASTAASSAASSSASTAASNSASSAASSSASTASSSAASSGATASTSSASSTPPASSSSSSTQSGGSSSSSSSQSSGSSSSSETKTETKSESSSSSSSESKSESKSETKSESKSEEKKSESKSEEKKEEKKEETKKEEKKEEKKESKKEEKKKSGNLNPMLIASDYTVAENADRKFGSILGLGWSRASMAGDEMFSANAMIWSNLKQFALGGGYTKMEFNEGKLDAIHSYGVTAAYLDGNYMGLLGYTWIKPHPKYGTYGYNVGMVNLFLKNQNGGMDYSIITSSVAFWTKPFQYSKKLTISPQVFVMASPISYNSKTGGTTVNRHAGFLLGSSFDYKLSKRFGFSFNYKFSGGTQPGTLILHNFLIGSRVML